GGSRPRARDARRRQVLPGAAESGVMTEGGGPAASLWIPRPPPLASIERSPTLPLAPGSLLPGPMARSALLVALAGALGAGGAPAPRLRGPPPPAEGRCCFNGCGDVSSCVTDYCTTREQCLSPQPGGGCDASPPHGKGARPSWCPALRQEGLALPAGAGAARPPLAGTPGGLQRAPRGPPGEGYWATFEWHPHAAYRSGDGIWTRRARGQCADSDASCYWRCGSGAYLTEEARGCTTGAFPLGQGWFDAVGDDCQTIGAVGARSTAAGGIFFGVEKGGPLQSDLFDAEGRLFWPVLALFASDYCTGPWQEYYGQSDSWEPRSLSGETPGAQSFKSYRIYMKPADEEEVEGTLGIKTVFFPYFDMAPYDQTICKSCQEEGGLCGGKSLYTPWSETQEWPGLDCVSPDDRVSCFTPGDQMWYATVNGNGGSGYGCVDFAGCTICESGSDQKFCEDNCPQFGFSPNDWCRGSPITSLYSYPLGSFYPITTCTSPQKPWGTAVRRAIAATACPRTTVRVTRFARLAQVCTTSTGIIVWRPASTTARTT
ncbi:unnamed protein product, partial [Prorocentrum cordatum]